MVYSFCFYMVQGSVSFILSNTIHIMIHMKRYSICINDTFCLVLDQINLICPQIYAKMFHLKYRVTKMNDTIYIIWPKYGYNRYIVIQYRALIWLRTSSLCLIVGRSWSQSSRCLTTLQYRHGNTGLTQPFINPATLYIPTIQQNTCKQSHINRHILLLFLSLD